jgi:hypothetical protein
MNEKDLETALRAAPQPKAPADLEQSLLAQASVGRRSSNRAVRGGNWLRRWWPALAPAAVSLACAAVITAQQLEIHDLQKTLKALSQPVVPSASVPVPALRLTNNAPAGDSAGGEQAEIQRLKEQAFKLSGEVTRLLGLRTENEKLRAQLAAPPLADLTAEEREALDKAKDRALSIACVNNLKQIGLAMRIWSLDNQDAYPPNFLVMSNELNTPKILVCPKDTAHQIAESWSSFGSANFTYEYLIPSEGEKPAEEPQRVLVRCPIHGHIGLADGSVQGSVAKNHPERLVERDGKLYMEEAPKNLPNPPAAPQPQNQ